jgi:hypothetical protein
MKQQPFRNLCGILVGTALFLISSNLISYAGAGVQASPVRTQTVVPRAYLAFDGTGPGRLDPISRMSAVNHDNTLGALAKISVVGGLLITADRLIRSVDSAMDAPLFKRDDGSCVRLNTESNSKGLLVGLTVSRPLDF